MSEHVDDAVMGKVCRNSILELCNLSKRHTFFRIFTDFPA